MNTIEKLEAAREKAIADSRAEGRAEGVSAGKEEKEMEDIRSLMETLSLSAKEAMKALKIPATKQKKYVAML